MLKSAHKKTEDVTEKERRGEEKMSFDKIILWVMAVGLLVGALDKITGNHFGLEL